MIFYVLSKGGDTDTNAAIVGGMIGAIVGFKNLPHEYLKKLL
jgi:ADP-ribosylglycohydrolase